MEGLRALLLGLFAIVIITNETTGFKVIWNVPTELCKVRHNMSFTYVVKEYGITMNDDDYFRGNEISLLYTPGLFPEIKGYKYDKSLKVPDVSKLTYINGGLPQDGKIMDHLDAFEIFINKTVPNPRNKGLIIIDMEHFGATWAQNFNDMEIYRIMSRKKVQDKNPTWTTAEVEKQAKLDYERAATNFIVKTLAYGKALRPFAKWGYYQYPQCFNQCNQGSCSASNEADNDQMILLWKRSDVLFPSAYLANECTPEGRAIITSGKVKECHRVLKKYNTTANVYPYIYFKYFFHDTFVPDIDIENLIKVPKDEGADGIIIWGSSNDLNNLERCKMFDDYVRKTIGPIAKKYVS
uniref:Hyaluronidase n=2 Tax=Clastoptera arizonana TaxID=38151 RepID=A0A1B6CQB0_9HEMI